MSLPPLASELAFSHALKPSTNSDAALEAESFSSKKVEQYTFSPVLAMPSRMTEDSQVSPAMMGHSTPRSLAWGSRLDATVMELGAKITSASLSMAFCR